MNDQILWQQPLAETPATRAVEAYLARKLGIVIAHRIIDIDMDNRYAAFYSDYYPLRFAVVIREGENYYPYVDNQTIYPRIGSVSGHTDGWDMGRIELIYAGGYGQVASLPQDIARFDTGLAPALATNLILPQDISYAIQELDKTFDDRRDNFADRDSVTGELGSVNYIEAQYRSTIPTEIRGLLMNHRRVSL